VGGITTVRCGRHNDCRSTDTAYRQSRYITLRIVSYHIINIVYRNTSYIIHHIVSYHQITSYRISYHIVSCIISYHIIYHIISYHIISYRIRSIIYIVSYHITRDQSRKDKPTLRLPVEMLEHWQGMEINTWRLRRRPQLGAAWVTKRQAMHVERNTELLQWKSNNYYIFWVCVCSLRFRTALSVPSSYLPAYEDGTHTVFRNVGI
jgi:hypothetical protein